MMRFSLFSLLLVIGLVFANNEVQNLPPIIPTSCKVDFDDGVTVHSFDFSDFANHQAQAEVEFSPFPPAKEYNTFELLFCDRSDMLLGKVLGLPKEKWEGWNSGILSHFSMVNNDFKNPQFRQEYTQGDNGYNCLIGRMTTVNVYCGACPGTSSCLSPELPGSRMCICNVEFDRSLEPCLHSIDVKIDNCPQSTTNFIPHTKPGGGHAFAIFLWIVFSLCLVAEAAGFLHNRFKLKIQGPEALPGYRPLRKLFSKNSQQPNYGHLDTSDDVPQTQGSATYGSI